VFAPPESVSDYNAATGRNYHFIASVLGSLKHGPRNPHTRRLAIVRFTHDARHSSVLCLRASTFQDMQAERDHLRNYVFPELEERLRQRRHHLEWVDLRVGVPTTKHAREQVRELQVQRKRLWTVLPTVRAEGRSGLLLSRTHNRELPVQSL
jgi:hypothetical protein